MIRVYLDACILISLFSTSEKEKENKKKAKEIINKLNELRAIEVCISPWVINETINILLTQHKMTNEEVLKIESEIINKKRLKELKIKILSTKKESQENYDFEDFFYDLREINLKYHPGIADAMHILIMKNNGVEYIITFNEKDFKKVDGLTVTDLHNLLSDK